jgi:nicotinamidase/pyrazinamidase
MIDRERSVLLLLDLQPDFMPGGALRVADGDRIIAPLIHLIQADRFGLYVATQDWHPPGHISFASSHPGYEPMQTIDLYGHEQTLWPDHCVQGTPGAELVEGMPWECVTAIIRKATDPVVDSYSAFRNNWNAAGLRPPTGLTGYLRERGIENVYLSGLARDVCVKFSALDAVDAGFRTFFLWNLTRSVLPAYDDALHRELVEHDVHIIDSEQLLS